jgi:hypothetical protein
MRCGLLVAIGAAAILGCMRVDFPTACQIDPNDPRCVDASQADDEDARYPEDDEQDGRVTDARPDDTADSAVPPDAELAADAFAADVTTEDTSPIAFDASRDTGHDGDITAADGHRDVDVTTSDATVAADAPRDSAVSDTTAPVCTPGTWRCAGSKLERCDSNRFQLVIDCGSAAACTPELARCGDCTPGEYSCLAEERRRCSAMGLWETVQVCASGALCRKSTGPNCEKPMCVPGQSTCTNDNEVAVCNADQASVTMVRCQANQMCCSGKCVAFNFGGCR